MSNSSDDRAPQPSGIVERLARDDVDRKRFLKMAGSAGAASFGAFVLAACGSSSSTSKSASTAAAAAKTTASSTSGDLGILNYALTLEYLETEFYDKVVAAELFKGKVGSLIKTFGAQEATHVEALKGAVEKLGGTPVSKPQGAFATPADMSTVLAAVKPFLA
jgi:Ferritin-like domain